MSPSASSPWLVLSASALGRSHTTSGAPNQDAAGTFETDAGVVIAVADGHGGARYTRSADGARAAVAAARRLGADALRRPEPLLVAAASLPAQLVGAWRAAVSEDLARRPLGGTEAATVGSDPVVAYGATLMVVLARGDEVVALQLGDGDVIAAWVDGEATSPVPADPRNVAGQTTSLCLPDAVASFRVASVHRSGAGPDLMVVSTDGYGNSFADPHWYRQVCGDLLRQLRTAGVHAVADGLPGWVAESAEVGGDDTTVAILAHQRSLRSVATGGLAASSATEGLHRPSAGSAGSATVPAPERTTQWPIAAAPSAPSAAPGAGARRPLWMRVAPAAAALLVGVTGGWIVRGDAAQPATTTPVTDSSLAPQTTERPIETVPIETVPPSSEPSTTASLPSTVPNATDDTVLTMAAGGFVVVIDDLSDPTSAAVATRRVDATVGAPVLSLWSTAGVWTVQRSGALLLGRDGVSRLIPIPGSLTAVGLAFNGGRVAVALADPSDVTVPLEIAVYDGATGEYQGSVAVQIETEQSGGPGQLSTVPSDVTTPPTDTTPSPTRKAAP